MKRCVLAALALSLLLTGCGYSSTFESMPWPEDASPVYRRLAYRARRGLIDNAEPKQYTLVYPIPNDDDHPQVDGYCRYAYRYRDQHWGVTLTSKFFQAVGEESCPGLNTLLRYAAVDDPFCIDGESDFRSFQNTTYEVECELTRSSGLCLSMRLRSDFYMRGAAYPNWDRWGLTVDLETGEPLRLNQIVDMGESFQDWARAQNWTPLNHWLPDNSSDQEYAARLIEECLPYDLGETSRQFYLTDDALVLIVWDYREDTHLSVPLSDLTLKIDL